MLAEVGSCAIQAIAVRTVHGAFLFAFGKYRAKRVVKPRRILEAELYLEQREKQGTRWHCSNPLFFRCAARFEHSPFDARGGLRLCFMQT
jgi:hypothetical protein